MKVFSGVALAMLMMLFWAASAAAAVCTDEQDLLTNWVPTHVHAGTPFSIDVDSDAYVSEDVANATLAVADVALPIVPLPQERITVTAQAPPSLGVFRVAVDWDQAPATGTTCHGHDDFNVTAVDPSLRIGDTFSARITGRWRMKFTPLNYYGPIERLAWRARPRCDFGACSTHVTSSSGAQLDLRLNSDKGTYRRVKDLGPVAGCMSTTYVNGRKTGTRTTRGAYFVRFDDTIRVAKTRDARDGTITATVLRGTARTIYSPTGRGRAAGCLRRTQTDRIYGAPLKRNSGSAET